MNWLTKKVNLNIKTTLGMFNLAKGVLLLLVIFSHSTNFHLFWNLDFFWETIPGTLLRVNQEMLTFAVISGFFIICGYGFRKMSMKKCIRQMKIPLIMYFCTALAAAVFKILQLLIIPEAGSGSFGAELSREVLAFLFGMSPGTEDFLGLAVNPVGVAWFLVAYVLATILLNAVLMIPKEPLQWAAITVLSVLGIWMSDLTIPFCLQQSMVSCGYMYVGYQMKKKKVFQKDIPVVVLLLLVLVPILATKGGGSNISINLWYRGLPDLVPCYVAGVLITAVTVKLDSIKGWFSDKIRWIGNNSLLIVCMHTISYKIMHWFGTSRKYPDAIPAETALEILFHCAFCFGISFLIVQIIKKYNNIR